MHVWRINEHVSGHISGWLADKFIVIHVTIVTQPRFDWGPLYSTHPASETSW